MEAEVIYPIQDAAVPGAFCGSTFTGTTDFPTAVSPASGFTGTLTDLGALFETGESQRAVQREITVAAVSRDPDPLRAIASIRIPLVTLRSDDERLFDAVQSLYLSVNNARDRRIAERIVAIYRAAREEGEQMLPESLAQLTEFFFQHPDFALPKITLTPDGTFRARWIRGPENFVAIEFTGHALAKLVAEVPRGGGLTAPHFAREPLGCIVSIAHAIGASFA